MSLIEAGKVDGKLGTWWGEVDSSEGSVLEHCIPEI